MDNRFKDQTLQEIAKRPLENIVTWILDNVEFDAIIECINKNVLGRNIISEQDVRDNIVTDEQVFEFECPNWYFNPDSYEDIVLYAIEKTKNKIFAPVRAKVTGGILEIECMYHDGGTFTVSYPVLLNILDNIERVPTIDGNLDYAPSEPVGTSVPLITGSLWNRFDTFNFPNRETFNNELFWESLDSVKTLSVPRLIKVTRTGQLEAKLKNQQYVPNLLHAPGRYGLSYIEGIVPTVQRGTLEEILDCQEKNPIHKNIQCVKKKKKKGELGFGNIQRMASKKGVKIVKYAGGKYHSYIHGKSKQYKLTPSELGKVLRSRRSFGYTLGQNLQTRPVSPHRYGIHEKHKSCFGKPNDMGPVRSAWNGSTHLGFPKVKYGYRGTQSTQGGATGIVGAPSIQNYILGQ